MIRILPGGSDASNVIVNMDVATYSKVSPIMSSQPNVSHDHVSGSSGETSKKRKEEDSFRTPSVPWQQEMWAAFQEFMAQCFSRATSSSSCFKFPLLSLLFTDTLRTGWRAHLQGHGPQRRSFTPMYKR